jgi:hypothetical protein
MTNTTPTLAVRYVDHDGTVTLQPCANEREQIGIVLDLLASKQIVAEPVHISYQVDAGQRRRLRQIFVEQIVNDVVDEERTVSEAAEMLRVLAPDLLDDDEVKALQRGGETVNPGCIRTHRIEQLAEEIEAARIREGEEMDDYDSPEQQQIRFLVDVLAGVEEHNAGQPCTKPHAVRAAYPVPATNRKDAA